LPKTVRELKQILKLEGFSELKGKGSHPNWIHPLYDGKLTVPGKNSSDAKRYLENAVQDAIEEVRTKKEDG